MARLWARLLSDTLDIASALGAREIEHVIDDPPIRPQFQYHAKKRIELLKSVGFSLRRETSRYEWRGTEPPSETERLSFRALEVVGEMAFVDAIERVSEGTLDREIGEERQRLGEKRAAQAFFQYARKVMHTPTW